MEADEISEGELCWFAFRYPNAFKIVCRMITEGRLKIVGSHDGNRRAGNDRAADSRVYAGSGCGLGMAGLVTESRLFPTESIRNE